MMGKTVIRDKIIKKMISTKIVCLSKSNRNIKVKRGQRLLGRWTCNWGGVVQGRCRGRNFWMSSEEVVLVLVALYILTVTLAQ